MLRKWRNQSKKPLRELMRPQRYGVAISSLRVKELSEVEFGSVGVKKESGANFAGNFLAF